MYAELLIDHAWGKESCTIADIKNYKRKSRSISHSQILPRNYNYKDAHIVMREMIQNGCYELFRYGYVTRLVHIYIGYGDDKSGIKGMVRMKELTNLYSIIVQYVDKLFEQIVDKNKPIRKIGFDFGDLISSENEQYDFFTDIERVKKEKKLVKGVLALQDKYGKNVILKGIDLEENATQIDRNKMIGGHNSE